MIALYFCEAVKAALAVTFPTVYIGLQHDQSTITLPAITLDCRADSVLNSPLYRATLTVGILSQADDTTPDTHAALVKAVGDALNALSITSSHVTMQGIVSQNTDTQRADRHWTSSLNFVVGLTMS
jgi:hypothetical protein